MHKIRYMKHYKLLVGLLIGFIISTALLLADELWEYSSEAEYDKIEKLLKTPQIHINTAAIQKIIRSINDTASFSFVVLGDNQDNLSEFKKILHRIKNDRPDFIIHVGDFTGEGKLAEYESIMRIAEQYEVPIVFGLGNHDIKNYGMQCYTHFIGPLNFFFDIGPYRLIFLNNTREDVDVDAHIDIDFKELPREDTRKYAVSHGLDDYQIEGLEELLLEKKKDFIFMHLPPPFKELHFRSFERNSSLFLDLVKKHRDRIMRIFCGHIHGYAETVQDGVQYIVTAGAGGDLIKSKPGLTRKFNYVLVRVSGDNITHEVKYCD